MNERYSTNSTDARRKRALRRADRRAGKAIVFTVVVIPAVMAIMGLVFDAGLIMSDDANLQHAVDSAANAGAMELLLDKSSSTSIATSQSYVKSFNGFSDAQLTVN